MWGQTHRSLQLQPEARKTPTLFRHGGSQAVRLFKESRFVGREVSIEKRD